MLKVLNRALLLAATLVISQNSMAFMAIGESAEVLPDGTYQIGLAPQFFTSRISGAQVNAYFDSQVNDSTSARFLIGSGPVDFNTAVSVKWVPFPDIDQQPAIGVRALFGFARDNSENLLSLQVAPIVSKKLDSDYGLLVPYIAVPFAYMSTKNSNYNASNITFGSEFKYHETPQVTYGAEASIDMNNSYSYIMGFVSFPFDGSKGIGR